MPKFTAIKEDLTPGKYHDKWGLILRVSIHGVKYWFWRGMLNGKRVDRGIGTYPFVSVAEARRTARCFREMAKEGRDPKNWKGFAPTFREAAEINIEQRRSRKKWTAKTEAEWRSTLNTYVLPFIGDMRVDVISVEDARRCVEPTWDDKSVLAIRLLQRINIVMVWAVGGGYRESWPPNFVKAVREFLGDNSKPVRRHPAVHHEEMAEVIRRIRSAEIPQSPKLLMEFVIQNAARSEEVCGLLWDEIDREQKLWSLPGERSKNREPNTRPLSEASMCILNEAAELEDGSNLVFPRPKGGKYSSDAISKLYGRIVEDMEDKSVLHGARSTFQDFSDERSKPRYVSRACLGHKQQGTLSAYARSNLEELRREHMTTWSGHIEPL